MRSDFIDLKDEIVELFNDKGNDYDCSDRLQVALHEVLDNWVTCLDDEEVNGYLSLFSVTDMDNIDKGMYEGVLEDRGLFMFHKVLLYCLVEQELYNEDDFNELQNIECVNGIDLT